jgi:cell cycle sensor histidine kinase DivJ
MSWRRSHRSGDLWSKALVSVFNAIRRQAAAIGRLARAASPREIEARSRQAETAVADETALAPQGDVVLRVDASGVALSVSDGAQEAFALHGEELLGRGFLERVHVGDQPSFLQAVGAALQRDTTVCINLRLRTGFQAESGRIVDPAAFALIEMRLHRCAGAPAVACAIKTLAKAGETNDAIAGHGAEGSWKDRMLANVSHELRTPLNAIIGFSEILSSADLAPADSARQREYAGIIHASAEHLLSVVNLILDMSTIEAGRFAIAPEPFDVAPLIASCCDMLRLKAQAGGVELVQAPLDIPSKVVADKRACRQIVLNLLSNAVKFTRPNGRVTVGASIDGDSLVITVADTGIGIAPGHFPRLGDPFFQARSSYDRVFEGTGLGLSLVRGLVGLHGGSLLLESVVDQGTRIAVRLPLDCRAKPPCDPAPARIETLATLTRASPAPLVGASCAAPRHVNKEKKIA